MKKITPILFLLFFSAGNAFSQRSDAINMASTVFHLYPDSMVTKGSVRPANWNYEIGVTMMGIWGLWEKTRDSVYIKYVKKIVDHFNFRGEKFLWLPFRLHVILVSVSCYIIQYFLQCILLNL